MINTRELRTLAKALDHDWQGWYVMLGQALTAMDNRPELKAVMEENHISRIDLGLLYDIVGELAGAVKGETN